MPKSIEPEKRKILQRRMELVWLLHCEGYSDMEIGDIMNGMDRTWVFTLRKRMPESFRQAWEKANKDF